MATEIRHPPCAMPSRDVRTIDPRREPVRVSFDAHEDLPVAEPDRLPAPQMKGRWF
jgi:hypothetical protein